MQNRFKFRAWDSIAKEYIFDSYALYELFVNDIDNSYQVEQCSGLKDKNGKLIYEGDIVEVTSPENWNIFDEYSNSEILGKGVVVTKPGCAFIKKNDIDGEEKKYYFALYSVVEDASVEVIGNIHENSELLEGNK
ncbi:YopX family protein [Streptomyces aculeolatus]